MAKKTENPTPEAERTMPVHPDPKKETILLRYPQNGDVKALAKETKRDEKTGKVHWVTTEPSVKNQEAFYEKKNSSMLADLILNFKAQSQNPSDFPELYKVPFNLVGQVASFLFKLQVDPKDDEALAMVRKYRTSTQQLEKVIYDEARMPKEELQAMGFDIQQMEKDGIFKAMELGKESPKLYPLSIKTGENTSLEGMYSIRAKQHETDEEKLRFEVQSPLAVPEFLTDPELKIALNAQDREDLRAGLTLDRSIMHDGEYCRAGFNRQTNRMIYVPCKDVKIPNFLYNRLLTKADQDEIRYRGGVKLEDCHYFGSDISFRGIARFDVHRMEVNIAKPYYSQVYIPEFIEKQLDKEMRETLLKGGEIDGRKLKGRDGNPYRNNLHINPETNGLEFVQYRRPEQSQSQAAVQSPAEQAPEPEMHIPDEAARQQSGQRVGM